MAIAAALAAPLIAAGVRLVELHGADGQRYLLNAAQITTIREPSAYDLRQHFAAHSSCIILTTDGKFIATRETCDEVREKVRP